MAKTLIAFFSRADVKKGLPLNGSSVARADAQIENWLKSNGLM